MTQGQATAVLGFTQDREDRIPQVRGRSAV